MLQGSLDSKILFITDFPGVQEAAEKIPLAPAKYQIIKNAMDRAGIPEFDYAVLSIHSLAARNYNSKNYTPEDHELAKSYAKDSILKSKAIILVPLGDYALEFLTSYTSIQKYHCSILTAKAEFGGRKVIPLLHPEYINRAFYDSAYIAFGAMRLKEELAYPEVRIPERKFLTSLELSLSDQISYLEDIVLKSSNPLSIDIETGRGIINTFGVAISPSEGIAIQCDPYGKTDEEFYHLWSILAKVWSSDIPKIAQNALFEYQWASKYGIRLNAIAFDTMWAMKFLHPALDKGLDNVGRIYTKFPYWKDDHSDWNNIRNWRLHLEYNVKDTTGTYAAYENQKKALAARGMDKLFNGYVMKFMPLIQEMCSRGMNLDETKLAELITDNERNTEARYESFKRECMAQLGHEVNPRSPKQMKDMFRELKIEIPTKKGKETTDKNALVKLRRKYPKQLIIADLMDISKLNKERSSYLGFSYDTDKKIRYSLDGVGTSTGRWAGYNDPFGNGFNPQTVPKKIRNCVIAEEGKILIQVDLAQAESRYVAFDSPEPKLMEMLANKQDVHKYVAGKIFRKHEDMVSKTERQLGKKSGHSANYGVGARTFAEACLTEMGIVLTEPEAKRIIQGYYEVFPGIVRRQSDIQAEIRRTRTLTTPLGRSQTWYDRVSDSVFREAYAYAPQSTIPDITNHLMLFLRDTFEDLEFIVQVHDSLLMQIEEGREYEVIEACRDYKAWHPKITLKGGDLIIPVDAETGKRWGSLKGVM